MFGGKDYFNAYQNPLRPLRGAPPPNTTGKLFMISLNFYVVFGGRVPERMRAVGRVGVGIISMHPKSLQAQFQCYSSLHCSKTSAPDSLLIPERLSALCRIPVALGADCHRVR
jgi:hypothetical protein